MKPYLGVRVALDNTHTHRKVENMLERDKHFGKIIDQSTADQDCGYEGQDAILNPVMIVVGLTEKVASDAAEDIGHMGLGEEAPRRRNS